MEKVSGWHLNCGSKHDILLHSSYYFVSCCSFSVQCLRLLEVSLYIDRRERERERVTALVAGREERRRGVFPIAVLAIKKWIRGREKEGLTACLTEIFRFLYFQLTWALALKLKSPCKSSSFFFILFSFLNLLPSVWIWILQY
jgi:hypothetical protein